MHVTAYASNKFLSFYKTIEQKLSLSFKQVMRRDKPQNRIFFTMSLELSTLKQQAFLFNKF